MGLTRSKFYLAEDRPFYRRFSALALTIALQNVIVFGVNLADNIMLGGYSELSLSAVALVNQIQFFLQMLVMGTGDGIVVLASRYWGENDIRSIKKVAGVGMTIGLGASILLFLAVFFAPHVCLGLLTDKQHVIVEATKYMRVICFTYIFFGITNILLAVLRSVETAKIGFWVSLSTLIINVCLNAILIYGRFGFPELGIVGAAVATLISRAVELLIVLLYVARIDRKVHLRLRDFLHIDGAYFQQFLKVSSPVVLSNASWGIAMGAQTSILGRMDAAVLPANSISTTVFQILSVVIYGAASATAVLVGKSIGEKKKRETIIRYANLLQILFVLLGILTGLCLFLFKDFIIHFYHIEPETRALAVQFMTVLSITVIGTSYQMPVLTGIVRGGGDTKFVLFNDIIFMWCIVLPSSALSAFVFHLSPLFVFICLKSDQILKCFVAIVKVNRHKWIRTLDSHESDE